MGMKFRIVAQKMLIYDVVIDAEMMDSDAREMMEEYMRINSCSEYTAIYNLALRDEGFLRNLLFFEDASESTYVFEWMQEEK